MKTIKQASKLSGASVRALQHYDNIGLLVPSRTENDYRLYSDGDIAKLQQILFLKELSFSLQEIRTIINNPNSNQRHTFRQQKELLQARCRQTAQAVRILERLENGESLDDCAQDIKLLSKESKPMKKAFKVSVIICTLLFVFGVSGVLLVLVCSNNRSKNPTAKQPELPTVADVIKINDVTGRALVYDIDIHLIDIDALPASSPKIMELKLPLDVLEGIRIYAVYGRGQVDSEYNVLCNYLVTAINENSDRKIEISFSADRQPLRDMYVPKDGEVSIVNGQDVMIGAIHDETREDYYLDFTANNLNYYVETHNLSIDEVLDLVKSLL